MKSFKKLTIGTTVFTGLLSVSVPALAQSSSPESRHVKESVALADGASKNAVVSNTSSKVVAVESSRNEKKTESVLSFLGLDRFYGVPEDFEGGSCI